jgi:SAM-dependent methyltransferase
LGESLSDWLALREPADFAARSAPLTRAVVDALPLRRPLRILDLATGTGSNVRYLVRFLPPDQEWILVDRDPELLAEAARRTAAIMAVETKCFDLGPLDHPEIFANRELVTASALLDLVSERWLRDLAERCRAARTAVLFALTYNGQSHCSPAEPEDDAIRELMNRHQRSNDKGFGRAAGPDAVDRAERCFAAAGYAMTRESSDWVLAPEMHALQRELIDGWADAAAEIAPEQSAMIQSWRVRRQDHVARHRSRIVVGHDDLGGWLP